MRFRLTQPEDFAAALAFLPRAFCYSPTLLDALPDIWSELLRSGRLISGVVEELSAPPGKQLLGVGLSVFVSDAFADDILVNPRPYANARLHDMLLAGHSLVLNPREIAQHNLNGGLNLMPLHFCTASLNFRDPQVMRILSAAQELFRIMHAGYRVKRIVKDVVNIDLCRFMQATGMNLVCDYASAYPELGLDSLPESERPYLLSIRHDEMPLGSAMSMMFLTSPVRFRFTPAEQRVLLCALLRETDEDIAHDLALSHDTVRKHWKSIFQRVQMVAPEFFPGDEEDKSNGNGRGREKRRHLLRYLQMHMEELRQHC